MSKDIDKKKISGIIKDCAEKYILPRFQSLKEGEVQSKSSPSDLVTIADIETEEALTQILEAEYPSSTVIGEESVSAGTKTLIALENDEGTVFVVDPVDGTHNFVHGKETFCVMLACVINGETRYGWIYDASKDRMLITEKGQGTTLDGQTLSVSSATQIEDSQGYANARFFPRRLRHHVKDLKGHVAKVSSLHCAGHEYLNMAMGRKEFSLSTKMRPWDHLAGALAVQEAGGLVRKWSGEPYQPQDEIGGLVAAANQDILGALKKRLINKIVEEEARR